MGAVNPGMFILGVRLGDFVAEFFQNQIDDLLGRHSAPSDVRQPV